MPKLHHPSSSILLKKYEEGRRKNSLWSQRSFAKRLGLSSGAVSEVLKGKRVLSARVRRRIAPKLMLSPAEEIEFIHDSQVPPRRHRQDYTPLSTDQFHLISDWWHFAILNLVKTKGFKPFPAWIAERLDVPVKLIVPAWDRLFRLGFLKKQHGKVVREYPQLSTTDGLYDTSILKSHKEDTKLIEASLENNPEHLCDHSSITLALDKKRMARAKELIRIFQDEFADEIESVPGDEVYRLSVSLFPLTKVSAEEKR